MIRRTQKFLRSRSADALSVAVLAALLSACSPSSRTAAAKPAAANSAPGKAATAPDPSSNLPEIVITASRTQGTPPALELKSARVRSHSRNKSS